MRLLSSVIRCILGRNRKSQPVRATKTYILTLNGPIDSRILVNLSQANPTEKQRWPILDE